MVDEYQYLENPQTSKLFDLVLQLATELHVVSNRLRAFEILLARKGAVVEGELDAFVPTDAESATLDDARTGLMERLVRIITEHGPAEHPLRDEWDAAVARKSV